jgi:Protein of unknown function (DUF3800)
VLVCYLDDSGTDDAAPILTMAGYVGTFSRWTAFEHNAKKIFTEFGVRELHGKEFNDTKADFAKWSRRKKQTFVARLYFELRKAARFGVTASIAKSAHAKAKSVGEDARQSAYGYCFGQILDQIMWSAVMKTAVARLGATLSIVVEAGNKNDADVLRIFNETRWIPHHVGVFRVLQSVTFVDKGSSIALQMADFLAFHARRYAAQCEKAREYLPMSDLQKIIFHAVPTAVSLSHEYLTNEEIERGHKDPKRWRRASPWL